VADLLECLIQIKGVADTPRRLGLRLAAAPGRGALMARRMCEAEECFGRCLALMLAGDRAVLPALPRVESAVDESKEGNAEAGWLEQFTVRRAGVVALLEQCSAEQLNRIGVEPSRGPMTVADLVAVMLAHDTDCLGAIPPGASPSS
jgi:hypothetical protein